MNVFSLLFTPGTKFRHFSKAYEAGADGIILDLEDSVGIEDKTTALQNILNFLADPPRYSRPFMHIVRINAISSDRGIEDLKMVLDSNVSLDAISIPKVDRKEILQKVEEQLKKKNRMIPLMAQIESRESIVNLEEIILECEQLRALAFGAADYSVDLGAIPINWDSLFYARAKIVFAASVRKLAVFDTPFFQITDSTNLKIETQRIKDLGFTGKLAIHPSQIPIINEIFSPSEKEIEQAKQIVSTFEKAKGNACRLDGQMIDLPIYERAKKLLLFINQSKDR